MGLWFSLGIFDILNCIIAATSWDSADTCERYLKRYLSTKGIKPKIARVIKA